MNKKQLKSLEGKFSGAGKTGPLLVSTISEWYDAKHRDPSKEEIALINSVAPEACPHCGSPRLSKDGFQKKTGIRVYRCRACGRKLGPLTGTVFDSRKIPISEWVEFLVHLFEFHSVATSAEDNRNADSTGRYWLNKVFLVLGDYQEGVSFSDVVWIDEAYVPVWKSEKAKGGGKDLRGLSRNQCCIMTATDGRKCWLKASGFGKPSEKKAAAYSGVLSGARKVIHDGEKAHDAVLERLGCRSVVIDPRAWKGKPDKCNPMEPVNEVHRYLKGFLRCHRGYSRRNLQDWLNLFCFIWNEGGTKAQKAQKFIEKAIKKKALLRFRGQKDAMAARK